ncbi:MAG: hypothetical protein AB8G77_04590 [Rhodothermales bacterium]
MNAPHIQNTSMSLSHNQIPVHQTLEDYSFTRDHPPLLRDVGFGYVSSHPEFTGQLESFPLTVPYQQFQITDDTDDNLFISYYITVKSQPAWIQYFGPQKFATDQEQTVTETVTQTIQDLQSLRALLSIEGTAGWGAFSTTLKAEIEATIEKQRTWSSETQNKTTVHFKANTTYCFWKLVDSINVSYDVRDVLENLNWVYQLDTFNGNKIKKDLVKYYIQQYERLQNQNAIYQLLLSGVYEDSYVDPGDMLTVLLATNSVIDVS